MSEDFMCCEAVLVLLFEHAAEQMRKLGRDPVWDGEAGLAEVFPEGCDFFAGERHCADDHLVEGCSCGPEIVCVCVCGKVARAALGRLVHGCADGCVEDWVWVEWGDDFGGAKVGELEHVVAAKHDVLGLDVAMDDAFGMDKGDGLHDLSKVDLGDFLGHAFSCALGEAGVQCASCEVFEHKIGLFALFDHFDKLDNVWVVLEHLQCLDFHLDALLEIHAAAALESASALQRRLDCLDGNDASRPNVDAMLHFSKLALAQHRGQQVLLEQLCALFLALDLVADKLGDGSAPLEHWACCAAKERSFAPDCCRGLAGVLFHGLRGVSSRGERRRGKGRRKRPGFCARPAERGAEVGGFLGTGFAHNVHRTRFLANTHSVMWWGRDFFLFLFSACVFVLLVFFFRCW
eukprot:comp19259_c0_seq1/m.36134 comp19259_c0_seq1/g.36134  ORF comp19259_c0_seq1/g.36134 comp19259_c0_seq1/m.36134 type:complete len:404 (+) comp19259_c0_seq1:528-1739(+)